MINYDKVIAFLERENPNATVVYRFKQAYHTFSKTGEWHPQLSGAYRRLADVRWSLIDDTSGHLGYGLSSLFDCHN